MTSFWVRERWMRSFVKGHAWEVVSGVGESQPELLLVLVSDCSVDGNELEEILEIAIRRY